MKLTYFGHSAHRIDTDGQTIVVDPFLRQNPKAEGAFDTIDKCDVVVLTHGHFDHIDDAIELLKKFDATLVAMFEIGQWAEAQGVSKIEPMNMGGTIEVAGVRYSLTQAHHSSGLMQDGKPTYLGNPAGVVIRSSETTIYNTGDTDIFSDMALIQKIYQPEIGLIPVGDRFTMGPELAAMACNEFLDLKLIVPVHWGTFPLLSGDPRVFKSLVTRGEVRILAPGEVLDY